MIRIAEKLQVSAAFSLQSCVKSAPPLHSRVSPCTLDQKVPSTQAAKTESPIAALTETFTP
eukprot:3939660-Rhodomonas_salina.1